MPALFPFSYFSSTRGDKLHLLHARSGVKVSRAIPVSSSIKHESRGGNFANRMRIYDNSRSDEAAFKLVRVAHLLRLA